MQLDSRSAVPQASQHPIIQSLSQDILIIPQLDGQFLFFHSKPGSCQPICGIIIANKCFSSAKAALFCSFRACGKNRLHLGCSNVMRSRGCAVQNKGITLKVPECSVQLYNSRFAPPVARNVKKLDAKGSRRVRFSSQQPCPLLCWRGLLDKNFSVFLV